MALLNTHETVKKFIKIGLKETHAEAIVEAINEQNQELATKKDLEILKVKLEGDIRGISTDIKWLTAISLLMMGMLVKLTFFSGN